MREKNVYISHKIFRDDITTQTYASHDTPCIFSAAGPRADRNVPNKKQREEREREKERE